MRKSEIVAEEKRIGGPEFSEKETSQGIQKKKQVEKQDLEELKKHDEHRETKGRESRETF